MVFDPQKYKDLTNLQKSSVSKIYNEQGADSANKQADSMLSYNLAKPTTATPVATTTGVPSIGIKNIATKATASPTGVPYISGGKPTTYTGTITPEGATNPYTGGTETVSPKGTLVGVNQGIYSPENKQKAWTEAGGAGTYNPEAFYRGDSGEMKIKAGFVTTPAPTSVPTIGAPTAGATPTTGTGVTGIGQLDTELDKIKADKYKAINDQYASYNVAKGQYEQNKNYYTNFNEVNGQYDNVLADIKNAMQGSGQTFLTDEQYKQIGDKYGLGVSDIKNPLNIFSRLNLTDEGKLKIGVTKHEQDLSDMEKVNERNKMDIQNNLTQAQTGLQNQLDDTKLKMQQNIDFAKASGAWSGAIGSSGYQKGLENMKQEGDKIVNNIQSSIDKNNTNANENLKRITEDYTTAVERSKQSFDSSLKDVKFNLGMQLNALSKKYDTGSTELTNALNKINEEFGTKSMDAFNKYLTQVKSIQDITNTTIDQTKKLNDMQTAAADKRFNEYLANNGQLLTNTSTKSLADEVKNGNLSQTRYNDLKNVMLNSINTTLSKLGQVNQADLDTATHMLDNGSTVASIIATIGAQDKFKTSKLVTVGSGSSIYDPNTGKWIQNPTATTTGITTGAGTSATGADLYKKMTASTNPIGVYATGDMDGSRHAAFYQDAANVGLDSYINKFTGTKITSDMVNQSAQKYGVDPLMIAATMALDSSMGTKGKGARNNNPGNIGQFDSLDAQGITVEGYPTLQDGVDAVANNLAKRQRALGLTDTTGTSPYAVLFQKYNSKGEIPPVATLKSMGMTADQFVKNASLYTPPAESSKITAQDMTDIELPDKASEFTKKSYGYGNRMNESDKTLEKYDETAANQSALDSWWQGAEPNWMKSEDRQVFEQAKRNFINATLRQESGAAIADSEFASADKQYFPQPGDSKEVIAQKAKNRKMAVENMYTSAGTDANGVSVKEIYRKLHGSSSTPVETTTQPTTSTGVGTTSQASTLKQSNPLGLPLNFAK